MQRIDRSWIRYLHGVDWASGLRLGVVLYLGWRSWSIFRKRKTPVVRSGQTDYTKCYGGT